MTETQAEYQTKNKANLELWNKVKQPPEHALKTIKGGRLKGMTDISPNWRYQAMTEQFGVCGIGWKYEITKLWTEPGNNEQVFAFAEIKLFIKTPGRVWAEPIPGIGGSMLVAKELSGLHSSDEAYKMAVTDALSVAMKMLGIAADIYAGLWDGSKYREIKESETQEKKDDGPRPVTDEQKTRIYELCKSKGMTKSEQAAIYKFALDGEQSNIDFAHDFIKHFDQYYDSFISFQMSQADVS